MDIKTWDITGFGGGYEATCQKMLWNAVRFLVGQERDVKSKQYESIYGIAINKGEDGMAFDKAMMKGIKDATGAMHQCATNHALYIGKNGYEKWFSELGDHRSKDGKKEYIFKYPIDFDLTKNATPSQSPR